MQWTTGDASGGSGGFGGEERLEYLINHFLRNTITVIPHYDLYSIP
jgi:hypothetical protein